MCIRDSPSPSSPFMLSPTYIVACLLESLCPCLSILLSSPLCKIFFNKSLAETNLTTQKRKGNGTNKKERKKEMTLFPGVLEVHFLPWGRRCNISGQSVEVLKVKCSLQIQNEIKVTVKKLIPLGEFSDTHIRHQPSPHLRNTLSPLDCSFVLWLECLHFGWKWGSPAMRLHTTKNAVNKCDQDSLRFSPRFYRLGRV